MRKEIDYKIKAINIAVTNKCNLRCSMCDIWKEHPKIDISLERIKKIFLQDVLDNNVDIALTGGEPFLHEHLSEITRIILKNNHHSLRTISTNGSLGEKIISYFREFYQILPKNFSLHISIDGIKSFNKQRGKPVLGSIISTIKKLKEEFPDIDIKVKFTITTLNYKEILDVYNLCMGLGLGFRPKLAENAKNYTNKILEKEFCFDEAMKKSIASQLFSIYKQKKITDKRGSEFIRLTMQKLFNKNKLISCNVPFERIFIMPGGEIYSCIHFNKIGNLSNTDLGAIWGSSNANSIREKVIRAGCNKCVAYHGNSARSYKLRNY